MESEIQIFPIDILPQQLKTKSIESYVNLFIRRYTPLQGQICSFEEKQYQNEQITIAIIVAQLSVSGIKCDYENKFWKIRSPSINNLTVGRIEGVAFQFPKPQIIQEQKGQQTIIVKLFIHEDPEKRQINIKELENFTKQLQKRYIVQKQFHLNYKAIKRIGKGVTANVYSALNLSTKTQVAIKSFNKTIYFKNDKGNGKKSFLRQFKLLTQLNSPYLLKLLGVYESDNSIYIVSQLLDKTLYNYLQKYSYPETGKCRKLLYQLLIGLRFLHQRKIMHRDIKLQNIMIRGSEKDNIEPVIVDFGLAQFEDAEEFVYLRCGTPGYVSPQVINQNKQDKKPNYDRSCDIFSLGVIFHILLLGKTVFQGDDINYVIDCNKKCTIDYEFKQFPNLSPEVKDLLIGMLKKNPRQRYTVEQLMDHQFFKEQKQLFESEVQKMDEELTQELNIKI